MSCAYCKSAPCREKAILKSIFEAGKGDIFRNFGNDPSTPVLNLAGIQRVTLHMLQVHIANLIGIIDKSGGGECGNWLALADYLHQYCRALQDYKYMGQCARDGREDDPFYIVSMNKLEQEILNDAGLLRNPANPYAPLPSVSKPANRLRFKRRYAANRAIDTRHRRLRRFAAFAGVLALLIPLLIVILIPGKPVPIITATVAMLVVAAAMAFSSLEIRTVLAVTAGYASVLVVFVGTQRFPYNKIHL